MRFAYADPPYLGQGKKHYGKLHPDAGEFDSIDAHQLLISRLVAEFPDGWALSLSAPSLRVILPMCPTDCRVGAWVKPFAFFKPGVNPSYSWEPVIWRGGRKFGRSSSTVRDFCRANVTMNRGFPGAKPPDFCGWLFRLLNMRPEDEFVDMFPGSGAVGLAWEQWCRAERGLFAGAE